MSNHETKQGIKPAQVQVDDQSTLPSSYHSFIAYGRYDKPYAPAERTNPAKGEGPLETGCDTHTNKQASKQTHTHLG